ncbi:hypothetical protein TURU_152653 [Turdus rufiventris]|nr:hypothetical protein TURU_152653 [Turdus rufiventris]
MSPPAPAPPGRSFTIAALLGRSSPPPGPPPLWGCPPAPLLPPLCAPPACGVPPGCGVPPTCGVPPGWAARLGATGFLISKCCLPLFKAKPGKAKRVRTIFSSEQLARLEQEFARQQYLVGQERCLLASSLHLTEEQVPVAALVLDCMLIYANYGYPQATAGEETGLELSHCVGTNSLGPAGPWRSGGPCKMKRVRTVFKPEQLERLEQEFLKQQYMVGTERVDLAATLHLTETQVKVWFQNRRIKWRKQSMEQKAAKLSQFGVIQPASADSTDSKEHEEDTVDVEL